MVKRTHWGRIAGGLLAEAIVILESSLADRMLIQNHALWVVQGYHDIIFAAWGLQGTLAGLTLAAVAIVVGRIDERSYGLTVKDLLDIPQYPRSMRTIALSFWDLVIFTLLSCGLNWIAALAGSLVGAVVGFTIGMLSVACIVHVCVVILSREETILRQCKEIAETCLKKEVECEGKRKNVDLLTEKICWGISEQIREYIVCGKKIEDLPEFIFFAIYLHRLGQKNPILFEKMNSFLYGCLHDAICYKQEENAQSIVLVSMNGFNPRNKMRLGLLPEFVRCWGREEVSEKGFAHVLNCVCMDLSMNMSGDYSEPAIWLLFFAVLQKKKEIYQSIWGAVISRGGKNPRKACSDYVAAILCAERYSKWKQCADSGDWLDVPGVLCEEKNTETLRQYVKKVRISPTFQHCFLDNAQVWSDRMIAYGERALFADMVEWLCFFSVYQNPLKETKALYEDAYKDWPQIEACLNEKGELKQEQAQSYANFCVWIEGKQL